MKMPLMKRQLLRRFGLVMSLIALSACVPSDIAQACKQKAIQKGYGKCSVEKGRQNSFGVWVVKLDCSRGEASCLNNTAGRVSVSPWTSMSETSFRE